MLGLEAPMTFGAEKNAERWIIDARTEVMGLQPLGRAAAVAAVAVALVHGATEAHVCGAVAVTPRRVALGRAFVEFAG